jgi:hypothetical protein
MLESGSFFLKKRVKELCLAARLSLPLGASGLVSLLVRSFPSNHPYDIFDVRGSPMTMFLPLSLSITSDRKTFLLASSITLIGNGCVSTCIS